MWNSIYRERFTCALNRIATDRPPMDLDSTDMTGIAGGPKRLAKVLNVAENDEAVLRALDTDIRGVGGILSPENATTKRDRTDHVTDCWGIGYAWVIDHHEIDRNPLKDATLDDLEAYPWPKAENISPATLETMGERARFLFEETPYVVCARHPYYGVMELGCWMCGFDDFLYRLAAEPEFVHRFFQIILSYQKEVDALYYARIGPYCHFTTSGDDFGTQTGPFLSPDMFHEMVQPYLKARIEHIRTFTDASFFHHTCGSVFSLIPYLIDAGVDILNPIQPHAKDMEPEKLRDAYGDRMTFYGGVDTQHLLPEGSPEQVTESVKKLIDVLRPGYILSAAHTIQMDVPLANVVALYRAV